MWERLTIGAGFSALTSCPMLLTCIERNAIQMRIQDRIMMQCGKQLWVYCMRSNFTEQLTH